MDKFHAIVCTRRLPLGCLVNNYMMLFNRATKSNLTNPYEEKAYSGPDYNVVLGEVEAKSMVDVALQRPTCAGGPGHQWLHTCIQGQGWRMLMP